jgi:hypothetical protein
MTPIARRRLRAGVLVMSALLGALPTTVAQAHGPDPVLSNSLFGQDQLLGFRWRSGAEPPSAIKTAIKEAAADVTASRASRAATFAYDSAGGSPIGYGPGATCGVNGIACFTRSAPDSFTMWLREHGRVFDWGTLKWCQMYSSPPNGCYDVETIALDEFGHVEQLGHHVNYSDDRDYLDAVVQTYSRTRPKDGWDEHVLGRCDVATLQRSYDVPTSSTKISTCLDIDTTLTISASTTATIYGGSVRFAAALKVAADDDYGRLKGNALSGRTVKLQRRTPGATTWTTVATMTPGSTGGTYSATATITADGEFRALYSATTTEGLNTDGSPVVTVSLQACAGAPCV